MTDKKILDADNQEKIKNEKLSNKQLEKVVGGLEVNPGGLRYLEYDLNDSSQIKDLVSSIARSRVGL